MKKKNIKTSTYTELFMNLKAIYSTQKSVIKASVLFTTSKQRGINARTRIVEVFFFRTSLWSGTVHQADSGNNLRMQEMKFEETVLQQSNLNIYWWPWKTSSPNIPKEEYSGTNSSCHQRQISTRYATEVHTGRTARLIRYMTATSASGARQKGNTWRMIALR